MHLEMSVTKLLVSYLSSYFLNKKIMFYPTCRACYDDLMKCHITLISVQLN